ncbi:MAG: TIGR04211 family SH3 domain-containing protein [Gammaproteobacteria bacterium]|nr:MAG: TIGR04211 family SH3 domain-containing protein [Gammaproteobacteria bacterium]
MPATDLRMIIVKLLIPALLFLAALPLQAETRYVIDSLYVPVRATDSPNGRIIHKGLKSGTALEVVELNEDGSFTKIRMGSLEGWIPSQYLLDEPIAKVRLEAAQQQLKVLQEDAGKLRSLVRTLEENNKLLEKQSQDSNQQAKQAVEELAEIKKIATNSIQLNENNKQLVKENEQLRTEVTVLSSEVERLKERTEQEWFLNGVIAVGFGVVLALAIPRLAPRRRRGEWK